MGRDENYNKKGITPEKIVAYVEKKAKTPRDKVAAALNVSERTVTRWVGEVDEYIRTCPEFQEAVEKLPSLIIPSLTVYEDYIKNAKPAMGNPDLLAARDILKYVGLFVDKSKSESRHTFGTDNELKRELAELLGGEDGDAECGDNEPSGEV